MAARKNFSVKYALYNTGSVQTNSDGDYSDSSMNDSNHGYQRNRYCPDTSKIEIKNVLKRRTLIKSDTFTDLHVTLHQLARDGNCEVLKIYLDNLSLDSAKIKVNELDENNRAPLHYAARYNHKSVVDLLLDRGADVNLVADDGLRPLHFAARYGYNRAPRESSFSCQESATNTCKTVICALVIKGAVINSKDDYGMSPLHYAAMRGNIIATSQLLKSANVNTEVYDNQEMTPLHCAVNYNSPEVVDLLLSAGAEPQVYDENNSTPLHLAATTGNKEIVLLLLQRIEERDGTEKMLEYIEEKNNSSSTALHLAVIKAHLEVVNVLLSKGANVKVPRDTYCQPLHLGAVSGNVGCVESLIKYGAKVNCINSLRETPLHKAAAYNSSDVIDFLLQNGAEIECRDNEHFTPLLLAASQGHVEAIRKLLDAGANVDVVDKMDRTVVFWAAQENHPEALKALLECENATDLVNRCDHYDNSPLHISALKGSTHIAEILLNNCAEIEKKNEHEQTPLHMAAKNGQVGVIQLLLNQSKTIVDPEDENSNTPLHLAALSGHYHSLKLLLHSGAYIGARNCYMWTALDCAASRGWKRCCQILLDAGCPVDSMDKSKTTPLHLAAKEGHKGIVKLLLKHGANIGQLDKDGKNCLDLAIDKGQIDVALEILSDSNWEAVLRNESDKNKFFVHQTPLRRLIRRMPEVASFVFDRCITRNEFSEDHPKHEVTFSYEFLDDIFACYQPHLYDIDKKETSSSDSSVFTGSSIYTSENHVRMKVMPYTDDKEVLKYNHPLMLMATHDRENLLSHPLCQSLLMHKWKNYGRYVYYSNLLIFVMFLVFLTSYILTAVPPCPFTDEEEMDPKCCSSRNVTCQPYIGECNSNGEGRFPGVCRNFIYGFALIHLLKEVYQVYQNGRRYFNLENFLEWACYLSALIFVADVSECSAKTGIREVWQWELGSLSIFCAWMVLVMFISKFPFLGIYVVMFIQILSTFVNFSFVFFLFVVAFALAFYSLLQNQDPFETPGESIMKTGVMMIGEFEFDAIFNDPDHKVYFKGPTYLLFVIFLLLMSIIIMNLLIGLAVDDIKGVQERAELKRLAMKVELVLTVERILPLVVLRKCVIRKQTVRPNAWHSLPWYWKLLRVKPAPAQTISKSTLDDLEEQQSKLSRQLKDIKESINLVQKDLKHIQSSMENKFKENS